MNTIHLLESIKPGGAENVAINYCRALNQIGINSLIVGKALDFQYEKLVRDSAAVSYKLDWQILKSTDIIFIHCNKWLVKLLKYLPVIKARRLKVIYVQHLNYSETKFLALSSLINLICTDFVRITPITINLVNKYIFIKTHFIVNFYISKYASSDWSSIREQIRNELNITSSKKVISFSAIFKHGKRLGDFLNLAAACIEDNELFFLLIGDGPEANLINNYKYDNLKWIGKVNDVEKYLIASDLYFFPSKHEMMPMALIEAINTNKSIIAYPTDINNFLLNNKTFDCITTPGIISRELPKGDSLQHYDLKYGVKMLSQLCRIE